MSGPRTAAEIPLLPGYAPKAAAFWIPKGEREKSLALVRKMVDATTDFSKACPLIASRMAARIAEWLRRIRILGKKR